MTSLGTWCAATAVGFTCAGPAMSSEHLPFDHKNWTLSEDVEAARIDFYRAHRVCASDAAAGVLGAQRIRDCSIIFMKLKLSFLPGATFERFKTLSPQTRALANRKGYAAYRAWLHRQIAGADPVRP